jgi:6-phosphofructokinase 2
MIVTVTLNPAVDKSTTVDKLVPEKKLRCNEMTVEAGGGGINVSKALHELEKPSTAIFPSGGLTGQLLENILSQKGIDFKAIRIKNDSRENFTVLESSSNNQFRFVLPGPALAPIDLQQILDVIEILKPDIIVASGSLAPGMDEDFIAKIAAVAKPLNAKLIADTSGKPLEMVIDEGLYLLKPNLAELSSLVGKEQLELNEVEDAARSILEKGKCEMIVVSMGASGAMLVTKNDHVKVAAPLVKKQSTVGAGDSMVAGMTYMISKNAALKDIVAFGTACGTAATMNAGSQLFKKADVFRLYEWIMKT